MSSLSLLFFQVVRLPPATRGSLPFSPSFFFSRRLAQLHFTLQTLRLRAYVLFQCRGNHRRLQELSLLV